LDQKLTQKPTWNRVFVVFRKLLILKLLHLLFLESGQTRFAAITWSRNF
jgi:hypothetical protein